MQISRVLNIIITMSKSCEKHVITLLQSISIKGNLLLYFVSIIIFFILYRMLNSSIASYSFKLETFSFELNFFFGKKKSVQNQNTYLAELSKTRIGNVLISG
jgi:hypothetical protein